MDVKISEADVTFIEEVIYFLETEYPDDIKEKQDKRIPLEKDEIVRWQQILNKKGWFAINWPTEYTNHEELSVTQKYILQEELAKANTPTNIPFGVGMCAPVVYTFGTDEQKEKFLPAILNSEVWWCQGYSEPGSGSDLASLKTKAELKGDKYIVNGAKTWTTLAQHADWIFCLVRTETTDIKQEGISFLLIDMKTPGIEVKPIITIDGSHEVNMVYFDNVEVPAENLVGEQGQGWNIAKFLLAHERSGIAGIAALKRELTRLKDLSSDIPLGEGTLLEDRQFRNNIDETGIALQTTAFTTHRTRAAMYPGSAQSVASWRLTIKDTDIQQAIQTL